MFDAGQTILVLNLYSNFVEYVLFIKAEYYPYILYVITYGQNLIVQKSETVKCYVIRVYA